MILIFSIVILLFSVVIHEVAHGSVAYYLGDSTAKYAKRLTLNPIRHLDMFGSIILPLFLALLIKVTGQGFIFGWAKPVPINPNNLRDKKWGELKVSLAGPASNLFIALFFGLIIRFVPLVSSVPGLSLMFAGIVFINLLLAIFNLIPIPPLDGSHILISFFPASATKIKLFFYRYGIFFSFLLIYLILAGIIPLFQIVLIGYQFVTGSAGLTPLINFFQG
jgi:Zn-dependent protease